MKRRTREDIESRDYVCACSRAYLSYSALHTHIRKYHHQEDKMMEKAIIPPKKIQQRGRPKHKLPKNISNQLEELTLIQTAILKIYNGLNDSLGQTILLQGDQQPDLSREKSDIQHLLQSFNRQSELQWTSSMQEAYFTLQPLSKSLTKHFKNDVAARIKAMLIAGYLQFTYQGGNRQQCMAKMQLIGQPQASNIVVNTLYDVLIRSLQRISLSGNSITEQEE